MSWNSLHSLDEDELEAIFSKLAKLTNLTSINLSKNGLELLNNEQINAICNNIKKHPNAENITLDLRGNNITGQKQAIWRRALNFVVNVLFTVISISYKAYTHSWFEPFSKKPIAKQIQQELESSRVLCNL